MSNLCESIRLDGALQPDDRHQQRPNLLEDLLRKPRHGRITDGTVHASNLPRST